MVLALHAQGKSAAEIRTLTGCTKGAVERYVAQVREQLAKEIKAKKVQAKIPQAFEELKTKAKPMVFLKGGTNDADIRKQVEEYLKADAVKTGAPPQVTRVSASPTDRVSRTGFSVTPARNDPPAPPINNTVHRAGSQFSLTRATDCRKTSGSSFFWGFKSSPSSKYA